MKKIYHPEEARRLLRRLEIRYIPRHGSWLDVAEIELNVMTRQCLSRRIETIEELRTQLMPGNVTATTTVLRSSGTSRLWIQEQG